MWGAAKIAGVPEALIWSELYYSDLWQRVGAVTNSAPLYALLAALGWVGGGRLSGGAARARPTASVALAAGLAALAHVATDLPLHHDDGHAHFWPFSDWVFASPVSYWDPAHFGREWAVAELALAVALVALLWRRYRRRLARAALALASVSYAVVALHWAFALG